MRVAATLSAIFKQLRMVKKVLCPRAPTLLGQTRDNAMATIEKRTGKKGTTWRARVRRVGYLDLTQTFAFRARALQWARDLETKGPTWSPNGAGLPKAFKILRKARKQSYVGFAGCSS